MKARKPVENLANAIKLPLKLLRPESLVLEWENVIIQVVDKAKEKD